MCGAFFTKENSWHQNSAQGTGKRIGKGIWGKGIFHSEARRLNHERHETHKGRRHGEIAGCHRTGAAIECRPITIRPFVFVPFVSFVVHRNCCFQVGS